MTFLPLVTRELRAASRRKSTYRIRRWTALIAFIVGLFFIAIGYLGGRNAGQLLFAFLTTFAVGFAFLAGIFLTPDCISEEKREGTLGLLFLTDLKGYDVVLGKFIARSLNAFYGMLALLPVAAISLLLGGLTGGEFWRTALALLNLLFLILLLGVFVSTIVRHSRAATGGTVLLIILMFALLPSLSQLSAIPYFPKAFVSLAYLSPLYPYLWSREVLYRSHTALFWKSLVASHIFGWFLLCITSLILPRIWQEKPMLPERKGIFSRLHRQGRGTTAQRAKARQRLLPINPILWVIGDEPTMRFAVWAVVAVWGIVITMVSWQAEEQAIPVPIIGTKAFGFLIKLIFASQACRFFIESRKSGALELLLSTPLRNREIIRGQWLALRRIFLWPLIVFALFNLTPLVFIIARALAGPGLLEAMGPIAGAIGSLLFSLWFTAALFADVLTIGWVSMWLALTVKKPDLAPAWTILFVVILPAPLMFCGLDLVVDIFLIVWASSNLQTDFRWTLSRQYQISREQLTPQVALPYVPTPPVIAR